MSYRDMTCVKCGNLTSIDTGAFTNPCENDHCDADYNWNGTLLAPRSQWGEETGETYTDICMFRWDVDSEEF